MNEVSPNCSAVRPLLTREELSDGERGDLDRHLGGCETCRKLRDQHCAVWSLLAAASGPPAEPPDAEFLSAVRARIRSPLFPRFRGHGAARRWLAAAAALLVVGAAGFFWSNSGSEDQAIIENLTVLEDLQAVPLANGMEFAEVGRELLSLLEEADAAEADELLDLLDGPVANKKG